MTEHATKLSIINKVLVQCGYAPIVEANFDNDAALEAPQQRAKEYFEESYASLNVELHELFTQRTFQLDTVAGTREYPVDELCDIESIMYHSLRCNTAGAPRLVEFLDYEEFRDRYPDADLTTMATGDPWIWTYTASAVAAGVERTNKILLYPIPDTPRIYEYQARLIYTELENATDKIIFPPAYQHILVANLRKMMERKAKTDDYSDYANEVKATVKQWAGGPTEKRMRSRNSAKVGGSLTTGQGLNGSKYL